jgi:hypothetical protein
MARGMVFMPLKSAGIQKSKVNDRSIICYITIIIIIYNNNYVCYIILLCHTIYRDHGLLLAHMHNI